MTRASLKSTAAMAGAAAAALVTLGALAACSSGPVAQTGAGTVAEVTAVDNSFRAETVEIKPGAEVTWTNRGRSKHDIVPTDGGDWGVALNDFESGDTYSHVFTEPGEYSYYCTIHGTKTKGMVGKIVVTE